MSNKSPQELREDIEKITWQFTEPGERHLSDLNDQIMAATHSHMQAGFDDADRDGYMRAISDFSGYFMDASIAAQRTPILPDIVRELRDNYRPPFKIKTKDLKFQWLGGDK